MKKTAERERFITRPLHRALRDYAVQLGYTDLIYLNIGEPDLPTPPNIVEAAKKALDEGFTHYTEERGLVELREAVALKLKEDKNLDVDSEKILVTNGSAEAIFIALMCLIDPGDEVILFDPYYPAYLSAVRMASGNPICIPVNPETLMPEPEAFKTKVGDKTKAIVINSPCNPTGMVYSKSFLKTLADVAVDQDLYVLSDEVYDKFVYDGEEFCSFASFFDQILERTIIVNSFSKTYAMTGWRVGYLAGNKDTVSKILKIKGSVNVCAGSISQKAALEALKKDTEKYVEKMFEEYSRRRAVILNSLSRIKKLRCPTPKGAFYVFPEISTIENDSMKFSIYLIKGAHVVVTPGITFGPGGEGHLRISYSSSMENIKAAMDRIFDAVEKYESKNKSSFSF